MRDRCGEGPVSPDPVLLLPTYLMAELLKLTRRTSAELFPGRELRPSHVVTLAWLDGHGPMSQRQVSERMRVNPADMVGVIDELERLGHVERRRDPHDRRRYSLHLTGSGRLALRDWRARDERLNDTVFAALAPHERETFRELLLKVLAHHDPRFGPDGERRDQDPVSRST